MTVLLHDPDNTLDYTIDWTTYLAAIGSGVTISSVAWAITPNDGASPSAPLLSGASETTLLATIKVSGVTAGDNHRLTCTMTPSTGQPADRSIYIRGGHR